MAQTGVSECKCNCMSRAHGPLVMGFNCRPLMISNDTDTELTFLLHSPQCWLFDDFVGVPSRNLVVRTSLRLYCKKSSYSYGSDSDSDSVVMVEV